MINKNTQMFIVTVLSVLCIVVILTSCGDINSPLSGNDTVSNDGKSLTIDFTTPKFLSSPEIKTLQAHVTIDGGPPHTLDVDSSTNQVSGTIDAVPSGTHELVLTYFVSTSCGDVILSTYSTQIEVSPGEITTVEIKETDINRNIDDDHDGYTNLAEYRIGTCALSASDVPYGESPHVVSSNGTTDSVSSDNFKIKIIVGSAIAGTTSSTNYRVIASLNSN